MLSPPHAGNKGTGSPADLSSWVWSLSPSSVAVETWTEWTVRDTGHRWRPALPPSVPAGSWVGAGGGLWASEGVWGFPASQHPPMVLSKGPGCGDRARPLMLVQAAAEDGGPKVTPVGGLGNDPRQAVGWAERQRAAHLEERVGDPVFIYLWGEQGRQKVKRTGDPPRLTSQGGASAIASFPSPEPPVCPWDAGPEGRPCPHAVPSLTLRSVSLSWPHTWRFPSRTLGPSPPSEVRGSPSPPQHCPLPRGRGSGAHPARRWGALEDEQARPGQGGGAIQLGAGRGGRVHAGGGQVQAGGSRAHARDGRVQARVAGCRLGVAGCRPGVVECRPGWSSAGRGGRVQVGGSRVQARWPGAGQGGRVHSRGGQVQAGVARCRPGLGRPNRRLAYEQQHLPPAVPSGSPRPCSPPDLAGCTGDHASCSLSAPDLPLPGGLQAG